MLSDYVPARLRTLLSNVKSFTYHPIIVCSSTGCFTGVQDLWKISNIPLRAKDGTVLFPRLVMSRLSLSVLRGDGSPQLRDLVGYDRTSRVNRGRFLKNVTILCLDSISADDSGSIAQIFGFFGMDIVRTVKFSMAGAPHSSTFPWILKKQRLLQTMILDDRGSMALQRYCEPDDIQGTKGYAQYLSLTIGAIWKNRDCWPELEEVVLRLGQENLQEVLTELRLQILQVSIFQLVEKAWLGKMLFWQIGNGTKTPLSI